MTQTRLRGSSRQRPPTSPFYLTFLPALLGVGALLLGAGPAMAQSLTISSGTATVSGAGTAVSGGVTFGGGAGPTTSSYQTAMVSGFTGLLNLQNGGSIQSITTGVGGNVDISGGTAGTLSMNGGVSSVNSTLTISGGTVTTVNEDRGPLNISGGTIQNVNTSISSAGPVSVSGGSIQNISSSGALTVSGGALGSVSNTNTGMGGAFAKITAGTIQSLSLSSGGGSISGGSIVTLNETKGLSGMPILISGGSFQFINNLTTFGNSINLLGTNLQEIGTPTDANNDGTFQLLGTLSDGEILNAVYTQRNGNGSANSNALEFNGVPATPTPVPEASTAATLGGLLLLGAAGLVSRARRSAKA